MSKGPKWYRLELEDGTVVAKRVEMASSIGQRALGLMLQPRLPKGNGVCIKPCKSVHTILMRFPIDVIFVDKEGNVLRILNSLKPWRMPRPVWRSAAVIELPAGTLAKKGVTEDAVLKLVRLRRKPTRPLANDQDGAKSVAGEELAH